MYDGVPSNQTAAFLSDIPRLLCGCMIKCLCVLNTLLSGRNDFQIWYWSHDLQHQEYGGGWWSSWMAYAVFEVLLNRQDQIGCGRRIWTRFCMRGALLRAVIMIMSWGLCVAIYIRRGCVQWGHDTVIRLVIRDSPSLQLCDTIGKMYCISPRGVPW